MNRLTLAAAAVCALFAALPAVAASNASASISNFSVTLFDLNPTDGVAPSISYFTSPYGAYVSTSASDAAAGSQSGTGFSLVPFGPTSSTSAAGLATASGSVSGVLGTGLLISAAGSAGGASLPGFGTGFNAETFGAYYNFGFALSPFTLAVFEGTVDLLAQTTLGAESGDFFFNSEYATASANINIYGPAAGGGGGSQNSSDGRSLYAGFQQVFNPDTGSFEFVGEYQTLGGVSLAGSFTNFSTDVLQGTLQVNAYVNGSSTVTAVPEPGTWALMLAGLLGVAGVARRRSR